MPTSGECVADGARGVVVAARRTLTGKRLRREDVKAVLQGEGRDDRNVQCGWVGVIPRRAAPVKKHKRTRQQAQNAHERNAQSDNAYLPARIAPGEPAAVFPHGQSSAGPAAATPLRVAPTKDTPPVIVVTGAMPDTVHSEVRNVGPGDNPRIYTSASTGAGNRIGAGPDLPAAAPKRRRAKHAQCRRRNKALSPKVCCDQQTGDSAVLPRDSQCAGSSASAGGAAGMCGIANSVASSALEFDCNGRKLVDSSEQPLDVCVSDPPCRKKSKETRSETQTKERGENQSESQSTTRGEKRGARRGAQQGGANPGAQPGANPGATQSAQQGANPRAKQSAKQGAKRRVKHVETQAEQRANVGVGFKTGPICIEAPALLPGCPSLHTREQLELFTRQRLQAMRQEQQAVGALHADIAALEARAAGMTARHMIYARRDVERQACALRERAEDIESGKHVNDFCREAAAFFYTFDRLCTVEQDQSTNDESPPPSVNDTRGAFGADADGLRPEANVSQPGAVVSQAGAAPTLPGFVVFQLAADGLVQTVGCHSTRNHGESPSPSLPPPPPCAHGPGEAPRGCVIEPVRSSGSSATGALKPTRMALSAEEVVTRDQAPMLVMPGTLDDMMQERQRQVSKPAIRLLARGRSTSSSVADAFLEQFGAGEKPLCIISDEKCTACGIGRLVFDTVSDVLVCEHCRCEQASTQASDRNAGGGSAQVMHFSTCRYRRVTHFVTHLDRFCGCVGSSKITPKILTRVMQQLKASGVVLVRVGDVENALKSLGLSKLVNHKVVITARITGIKPPSFSPDERYQLIDMFLEISDAFMHLRRTNQLEGRLNYLSYSYTIFKFVQLLKWGQCFLTYFRLLRGPDNLAKQDRFWKKICVHVGFLYISSEPRLP